MKVLGLTGGIGMGKSACADLARARGVPVIDTDLLARKVVEPGQPALAEIQQVFGPDIVDAGGRLRRSELAERVFADPSARKRLESILHPRIRELWREQARAWPGQGHRIGLIVIPLLFETHSEVELDATVCLACSAATQRLRLLERGWSQDEIERRNRAQLPIQTKMDQANFVIWTEGSLDLHAAQLDRILDFVCAFPPASGKLL